MAFRRLVARSAINPPDTTPPSGPTTLTLVSLTASAVTVSFTPATDNRSVSGYEVYVFGSSPYILSSFSGSPITVTGLDSGTSYDIYVRAFDQAGNRGDWSNPLPITTLTSGASKSWNPGMYAFPNQHMFPSKYANIESDINSLIAPTDKRSRVTGVFLLVSWAMLNPSPGVYDWTKLDYFIDYLKDRNLRVGLYLTVRRYGGAVPGTPQADYREAWLPDFVISNGWAGVNTDDLGGYTARFDITACTDAYLTFIAALGAHLNGEPFIEEICSPELSAAFAPGQGFSQANWNTQWTRMPAAFALAFPNKIVTFSANYHSSVTVTNAFVDECMAQGVGITGPDIMPQNSGSSEDHWGFMHLAGVGVRVNPVYGPYDFGTTNYIGRVATSCGQQVIQSTSFTPSLIYSHGNTAYYLNKYIWTMHGDGVTTRFGTPVPAMEWETGVWPYLRDTNPAVISTFPTRLAELGFTPVTGET
jgi:hypothetical protein